MIINKFLEKMTLLNKDSKNRLQNMAVNAKIEYIIIK